MRCSIKNSGVVGEGVRMLESEESLRVGCGAGRQPRGEEE
jgi:hypothetical protein